MKSRIRSQGVFLVALCIVHLSFPVLGVDFITQLSIEPSPVARGETVTISVILENASGTVLEEATLSVPLPAGIDQWAADVRINGGIWTEYPANGLIELDPLPAFAQVSVDIRVPIESASPATLLVTAQLLDDTGILEAASAWVNALPRADAGPDLVSDLGTPITLADASASDGDGVIVSYLWTDFGAGGAFSDNQSLHANYTPPALSGVIELGLTVTDVDGGQSSDSLRLRVNAVPSVDVGEDLTAEEDSQISLGTAIVSDSDGWIAQVRWSDGGAGGIFLASADVMDPIYLVPEIEGCGNGLIVLTLAVADDGGATNSDTLTLHVSNINELPRVDVPEDLETATGQRVSLSATASDEDGWIEEQHWVQVDGIDVDLWVESQGQHVEFDAPDVDASSELVFRFTARDNCGTEVWNDVMVIVLPTAGFDGTPIMTPPDDGSGDVPGIIPPVVTPPDDGTDSVSRSDSSLSASLDMFDERGLPMSPFSSLKAGDVVTIRVGVTNTGSSRLSNLTVSLNNGSTVDLHSHSLDTWSSTTGTVDWVVGIHELTEGLLIEATVFGNDARGRSVMTSSVFEFLGAPSAESADLSLEVMASPSEVGLGEIIVYEYWLTNIGPHDLVGLTLLDNRLGWIGLPISILTTGQSIQVQTVYAIHESDLPGPLVSGVHAIAFTPQGDKIEAEADVSVELRTIASGAGGGSSFQQQARVVISEIAWAGSPYDSANEWIELANIGTSPVDLHGWRLSWYEKKGTVPPVWQSIELSGVIQPLPAAAWQVTPLQFTPLEDGLWAVNDPRWPQTDSSSGFFVIERAHDDVVANVSAGLVYGNADNPYFELPDAGAAMFLLDADGQIVDSANAQYANQQGWPAGNALTGATMERINLNQGDFNGNWQTSSGVLTHGTDALGHGLTATAGMPNSMALDILLQDAAASVNVNSVDGEIPVVVPGTATSNRPVIQVAALARSMAIGGDGAVMSPSISTSRSSAGLTISVDLSSASSGSYFVWITGQNGATFALPLDR